MISPRPTRSIIPVPPASSSRSRLTLYKVEHGDTLVTVADRFNMTVQQLRRWNHLTAAQVVPGRRLYVAEPARVTSSQASVDDEARRRRETEWPLHCAQAHTPRTTAKNGPPLLSHSPLNRILARELCRKEN